jgi:uncharacterized YigZ family protein
MSSDRTRPFRTCGSPGRGEFREKGSRFLGLLEHAPTRQAVEARIEELRREHHDATHVCSAWRLRSEPDPGEASSDDGEPSGTAGVPMAGVLRSEGLWNVLGIVIRWYGGTKLGRGGLIRAYREAMALAVADAGIVTSVPRTALVITAPVANLGDVHRALSPFDVEYGEQQVAAGTVRLAITLPATDREALTRALPELTAGQAAVAPGEDGPA